MTRPETVSMTNCFSVVGEHRDDPDRLLLLGEDGGLYDSPPPPIGSQPRQGRPTSGTSILMSPGICAFGTRGCRTRSGDGRRVDRSMNGSVHSRIGPHKYVPIAGCHRQRCSTGLRCAHAAPARFHDAPRLCVGQSCSEKRVHRQLREALVGDQCVVYLTQVVLHSSYQSCYKNSGATTRNDAPCLIRLGAWLAGAA